MASYVGLAIVNKDGQPVLFHTVGENDDNSTPFEFQLAYFQALDQLDQVLNGPHRPSDAFVGLITPVLASSGEYSLFGYAPCSGLRILLLVCDTSKLERVRLYNEIRSTFQHCHSAFARAQCSPAGFGDVRFRKLRRQFDAILTKEALQAV